ncbi:MAG: hypothetical protein QGG53_40125 [Planctomycetota bacterium]|nr:hypothetical protein [Planctomycetota bacterium]
MLSLIHLLILILPAGSIGEPVSAARVDGKLILENGYVKGVICPDKGGALTSFVSKESGGELLSGPCFLDSNILPGRRIQSLSSTAFSAAPIGTDGKTGWTVTARLPEEMGIDFGRQMVGRAGEIITYNQSAIVDWPRPYQHLQLAKKFSLTRSSATLTVDYEISNTGDEVVEVCLGTTHSFAGSKLCIPTREGAASFPIPIEDPQRMPLLEYSTSPWLYDVPSAWCGMLKDEGRGVVGVFDSRHISFLRPSLKSGSVLLGRTRARIEPGKVFRTSGWLMPLERSGESSAQPNPLRPIFRSHRQARMAGPLWSERNSLRSFRPIWRSVSAWEGSKKTIPILLSARLMREPPLMKRNSPRTSRFWPSSKARKH